MKGHPAKSLALALVALAAVASVAAGAGSTKHPTGRDLAVREGCQRTFINITLVNSPEWVYVHRDPTIHVATGITRVSHPSNTDQPGSHTTFDFNSNLVVDRKYSYLLAGSPATKTNNFAGEEGAGEATGRLHYEWEMGTFPQFAWPADGDRTTLWGSWIWDCGHFSRGNTITGEKTEFHPLNAVAVNRSNPYVARAGESETDFFMSSDGTYAHAQEQCALKLHPLKN